MILQPSTLTNIVTDDLQMRSAKLASHTKASFSEKAARFWGQGGLMFAQERVATFFGKSSGSVEVEPGKRFRHCSQKLTETAEVLALMKDEMGIPHVRFSVTIQSPYQRPFVDGPRTLNLKSFRERYREALAV